MQEIVAVNHLLGFFSPSSAFAATASTAAPRSLEENFFQIQQSWPYGLLPTL